MKPPILRTLSIALAGVISSFAMAATPPPKPPFKTYYKNPLSEKKPAASLRMGSFEVVFEKTTLAMVIKAANRGQIAHQGDAADRLSWVCYTIERRTQNERIWVASGEMGGSEHAVTQITAQVVSPADYAPDCPKLPKELLPVSFGNAIWLGTEKDRALSILGRPSEQEGSWWAFDYTGKVPGSCSPEGYDIVNWFMFESKKGRLASIHAGQISSC